MAAKISENKETPSCGIWRRRRHQKINANGESL